MGEATVTRDTCIYKKLLPPPSVPARAANVSTLCSPGGEERRALPLRGDMWRECIPGGHWRGRHTTPLQEGLRPGGSVLQHLGEDGKTGPLSPCSVLLLPSQDPTPPALQTQDAGAGFCSFLFAN